MRTSDAALGRGAFARAFGVRMAPNKYPVFAGMRPRRRGGLVLQFSEGPIEIGCVVGYLWGGKLFAKDIFALGGTHDELLVTGEFGGTDHVHGVDGVKEAGQTVLRGVRKVVIQSEQEDGLVVV